MTRRLRVALLAALPLLPLPGAGPEARAMGLFHNRDAVYAAPIETVLTVPTAYVATAYAAPVVYDLSPTAYVVPTVRYRAARPIYLSRVVERPVYAETRYAAVYDAVPTVYVRPLVTTSRVIYDATPTVYSPTVYSYSPTVYSPTALVATSSSLCCDDAVRVAPPAVEAAPTMLNPAPARPAAPARRQPPANTDTAPSSAIEDDTEPGFQPPPAPAPAAPQAAGAGAGAAQTPATGGERSTATPVQAPATPPNPAPAPLESTPRNPESQVPFPNSPTDLPAPAPETDDATFRQSRRPVIANPILTGMTPLKGRVRSTLSNQPEPGVQVIASDRARRFVDRVATTDVDGRYRINLPDGDWRVQVVAPSGRVYEVSRITVAAGQIVDDQDRIVASLLINR